MERLKILLTRSLLSSDLEYIQSHLDEKIPGRYCIVQPEKYTEDAISREASDADVLLGPYITEPILRQANKLRLIQIPWTGLDTFNFDSVQNCSVPICNTHSNADAVAEFGMALIFDLLKKLSYHDRKMRSGNWNRDQKPLSLKSRMLSNQKICILGFGHIGKKLAAMLNRFGCEIDTVSTHTVADFPYHRSFSADEMIPAINSADIVVSTLPLTYQTENMIDEAFINSMAAGALLVNLSRARIIDEAAVYNGLLSGKLGGFASDVWWKTPARGESESWPSAMGNDFSVFENVVFSPHRAGFVEGELPHLDGAIANIISLCNDLPLEGIVNKVKRY